MAWTKSSAENTKRLMVFLILVLGAPVIYFIGMNEYSMWSMKRDLEKFAGHEKLEVLTAPSELTPGPELSCHMVAATIIKTNIDISDDLIERYLRLNNEARKYSFVSVSEYYVHRAPDTTGFYATTDTLINFDPRCFLFNRQLPDPELDKQVSEFFGSWETFRR